MDKELLELLFDKGTETASIQSEEMLLKALSAEYGTDAATYTGGQALRPEDCETTMVNAMREQPEDCMIMNTFKKRPIKSTVHQYNRRTGTGEIDYATTEEGGLSQEDGQEVERIVRLVKYTQQYREVTEQIIVTDTFEPAYESEKIAGTFNLLKINERLCIHGDKGVIPTEYDGLIAQIKNVDKDRRNIIDFRGERIQDKGQKFIPEMVHMIHDQGGDANKAFFPTILAVDIQELLQDRFRVGAEDKKMAPVFDSYPTPFGTVKIGLNSNCGPNKLFRVRGPITAKGKSTERPDAPLSVTGSARAASGSEFSQTTDAGNYIYEVFSVNMRGNSAGKTSAVVPVDVGEVVDLVITPDLTKNVTGFIIARTAPNGTVTMEMVRIGRDKENPTTAYTDFNKDLPGTTDMIFITERKIQTVAEFYQLLPLRLFPMNPVNRLVRPFILALWGGLDLKVPEWCGLVKNVAYEEGFYG